MFEQHNLPRSKRSLNALNKEYEFVSKSKCNLDIFSGGGGSSGGSTQSTATSYNTNIPEYAQPYVTSMLNATQQQLFNVKDGQVTGFAPYVPYSANPADYVAGFSPMQQQAFRSAANLQTPSQFGVGSTMANQAGQGALGTASQATGYGELGSRYGAVGSRIGEGALGYGGMGAGLGMQAAGAGGQYAQQVTSPGAVQAYMSPYQQLATDVQKREAQREFDVQKAQRNAAAVKSGAFGGSRQGIMESEAQRNLNTQLQNIQAAGNQAAYDRAIQSMQYGSGLGLQGLQAGMQGAQTGLQGIQGALAGTAQGMQGAQIGLQGVQGAQAGYGLANQAAGTLGQLGSAQLAAQQGIIGLQSQLGAQQQGRQQQIINQAIQDYANAQQYPLTQLGTMSNMLRGLPLQSSTTQQYVAQPNMTTQAIGTLGAGASLYNAMKAKGGIIDAKEYAGGGVIDSVESKLYDMDEESLQKEMKSPSPSIQKMARRIMMEKRAEGKAGGGIIAFADSTDENNQSLVQEPESFVSSQRGIVADAPASAAPEAVAPKATPLDTSPAGVKKFLATKAGESEQRSQMSIRDLMKEKEDILGKDTSTQDYRKRVMEERANSAEESRRQNWMRAAEFFANWGSLPGNTLAAGMQALKSTIPNVISDQKEVKKYNREIDKTLYELARADRADAEGNFAYGAKIRQDEGERAFKYAGKLSDITEAEIRASAARAGSGGGADAESKKFDRAEKLVQNALKGNPEYQSIIAGVKTGAEPTADQLARVSQIESSYRDFYYGKAGLPTGGEVKIPESPAAVKAKREKLEKEVEANTPTFGFMDSDAKKKKREEAKRELDAMGGSSDNKDRKPLSSFQS